MPRQSDLRFTFAPAAGDFEVIEFTLDEAISEPFVLRLELASFDPAVDFGKLLDRPALFTLWRGETPVRYVHGIVSAFTQRATGFRRTRYSAVVEPALARAALCSDWRIFQQQSVPQILQAIVRKHHIAHYEQVITATHLPREYCVQAGDTDLHFLHRLGTEEGLFFRFAHTAETHRLIHGDMLYIQGAVAGGPVLYNPAPGGDQPEPALRRFDYTERVRTARQTQRDYTFKHSRYNQEHSFAGPGLERQGSAYERYDFPGRYKLDEAGKPFTRARLLGLRRDARMAYVEGDDARLVPGVAFDLAGHPREDWNHGWRPVRMRHAGVQHASQAEESAGGEQGTRYGYTAEIVPDRLEWRPEPCAKPRIDGPHVATVVGPPDEEVYTDAYGRVKVQFPWDREGKEDERSSCWIRVAQNWAGRRWGHMAIPRIGHEVIVDFLDGDCDQPVITARAYPAINPPPYELPKFHALTTIKSKEHKTWRANELRLDDTHGQISAALMSDHGESALHLGYLTHPRPDGGKPRGEGFELRTDEHGALRAARGLLLSTDGRAQAQGGQLSRGELVACLESALALARQLGDYAARHETLPHDAGPQRHLSEAVRDLGHGANDEQAGGTAGENAGGNGGQPLIALSSPAGIAAGTPQSITLAAGQHIDSVAAQNQQITAGQALVMNAGQGISQFAQGGDMRHIAHRGQLLLQAQHNAIRVQADRSVEISASREHVLVAAEQHITLLCGGAYIKIAGGNIEMGMPGTFTVKAARFMTVGPDSTRAMLPAFKSPEATGGDHDARYRLCKTDERAFQGYRYRLMSGSQLLVEGVTGQDGETDTVETERKRPIRAYKSVMREDQRITEDWKALISAIDDGRPHKDKTAPFDDDAFLDQFHSEED
ncbi:type VI secretion system Vgr family protein [Cupriavidus sp. 30B13]|uniref:type VI secretion system Vgr family protein n=1 Tax=Cupriavidus sp. 30B13 TaxID=3384241 RepID=UPI003B916735